MLALAVVIPAVRLPAFVGASWLCTIVFGWRLRCAKLQPPIMWALFTVLLAFISGAETIQLIEGHETSAAVLMSFAGHICAIPGLLLLAATTKNSVSRVRGRATEWALILLAAAATTTQITLMHPAGSGALKWGLLAPNSPPVDALLICLLLRLLITRSYLPAGIRLLMWGAGGLLAFDLSIGAAGERIAASNSATLLIGLVSVGVLTFAVSMPSATFRLASPNQYPVATGSLRLLSMVPLIMAPPAIWGLGYVHVLPETSAVFFAIAQSTITFCALMLAVQCLRAVEDLAERDIVTGVTNRRGLPRVTQKLLSGRGPGSKASLAVVDLDRFKEVNDRYGHDVGDLLLRMVAQRLRLSVGAKGAVCRVGGDEFVVIYVDDRGDSRPEVHSRELTRRINAALERPCDIKGHRIQAAASVGVTPLNRATDLVQVMVNSDAAMYAAKIAAKVLEPARGPAGATLIEPSQSGPIDTRPLDSRHIDSNPITDADHLRSAAS